jgi:hypothetical protein
MTAINTPRTRITLHGTLAVAELLTKHCSSVEADGPKKYCKYAPGFTDRVIADLASKATKTIVTPGMVAPIRVKLFGEVVGSPRRQSLNSVERLDRVEKAVEKIAKELGIDLGWAEEATALKGLIGEWAQS